MRKAFVLGAIASSLAAPAYAVVNVDSNTGVNQYANELIDVASLIFDSAASANYDITGDVGFGASDGDQRFIRFDLINSTFETGLMDADLTVDNGTNLTVAQGGLPGDSFVIYSVTADAPGIAQTDDFTLDIPDLDPSSKATGQVTVTVYETGADAAGNDPMDALVAPRTADIFAFRDSLTASGKQNDRTDGQYDRIDVAQNSLFFEAAPEDPNSIPVLLDVDFTSNLIADGTMTAFADFNQPGSLLTFDGDFSPFDAIDIDGVPASSITSTTVSFDQPTLATAGPEIDADMFVDKPLTVAVPAMNTTPIETFLFSGSYTAVGDSAKDLGDITITQNDFAELGKNGSEDETAFSARAGGVFPQFFRVSNTSVQSGLVFLTVWDDAGERATVELGAVTGGSNSIPNGGASPQFSVDDLMDAAVLVNPSLDVTSKLRVRAEGEFASINLQAYSTSKDGNSLTPNKFDSPTQR